MNAMQRGGFFCVGLASGFFVGCMMFADQRDQSYSNVSLVMLAPLSGSAAYGVFSVVRAWRGRRRVSSNLRRFAAVAWVVVAFAALATWPACLLPHESPLGTWCAVSSLVAAVATALET